MSKEPLEFLPPTARDADYDRDYYPVPGGWEIQTKGKGSSFRLANMKTGERTIITDRMAHDALVEMAKNCRAACETLVSAHKTEVEKLQAKIAEFEGRSAPADVAMTSV